MVNSFITSGNHLVINDSNWLQYALNNYENPHLSSLDDFDEDLKRFSYIISLLNKYENKDILKHRLILNHIIILCNCFGVKGATNLLWYKIPSKHWKILGTFLLYLNMVESLDFDIDHDLYKELNKL